MEKKKVDLRIVKTKKKIKSTIIDMLGQMDFNQISITDLTSTAGVNRATFYLHYSNTFDVLKDINKDISEILKDKFDNLTVDNVYDCLINVVSELKKVYPLLGKAQLRLFKSSSALFVNKMLAWINDFLFEKLKDCFVDTAGEKLYFALAHCISGFFSSYFVGYGTEKREMGEEEFVDYVATCTEKSTKVLFDALPQIKIPKDMPVED